MTSLRMDLWQTGIRMLARPLIRRAAREALQGRLVDPSDAERGRWLRADVKQYLAATWQRVDGLLPAASLAMLPTWGNRLNGFMAVVTTAAYQELLDRGVDQEYAATLVADVGWKVYAWMLSVSALPARLVSRRPQRQLDLTLRLLMRFPFSAPGKPGYEVEAWSDGERSYNHWTHCPPQAFVRALVEAEGDRGELDAFYRAWCLYDWAGADLLARDGKHGHYERPHTMSRGDSVCDMCWWARSPQAGAQPSRGAQKIETASAR